AAHLIDSDGPDLGGESGTDGRLSGRSLAQPGAEHAAHHHFFDLLSGQVNACEGLRNGETSQGGGGQRTEDAVEAAHGGASRAHDHGLLSGAHNRVSQSLVSRWCFTMLIKRSAVAPSMI